MSGLVSNNTCKVANHVPDHVDVPPQICQEWSGDDAKKSAQEACLYDKEGNNTVTGCSFTHHGGTGDIKTCTTSSNECCSFTQPPGVVSCTSAASRLPGDNKIYFTGQWNELMTALVCQGSPFVEQSKCLFETNEGKCEINRKTADIPPRPCDGDGDGWVNNSGHCCDQKTQCYQITPDLSNCSTSQSEAEKLKKGDYGYNTCTLNSDDNAGVF